jgi:hypothetical protein
MAPASHPSTAPLALAVMLTAILSLSSSSSAGASVAFDPAAAGFKLYWANTTIDHFNFVPKGPKFPLRVYVDDTHWDPETGPILFCAISHQPAAFDLPPSAIVTRGRCQLTALSAP